MILTLLFQLKVKEALCIQWENPTQNQQLKHLYLLLLLLLISFLLRYHRWLKLTFREKAKD